MIISKKDKPILIGCAVIYKKENNKTSWFAVRQVEDGDWELPKATVRRGESSVRSVIRIMAEQGGMKARVLEEVGRASGAVIINGNPVDQKYIYYLMLERGGGEILGFSEYSWFEHSKAMKKLTNKKDQAMLSKAKEMAKEFDKKFKKEPIPIEEELGEIAEEKVIG